MTTLLPFPPLPALFKAIRVSEPHHYQTLDGRRQRVAGPRPVSTGVDSANQLTLPSNWTIPTPISRSKPKNAPKGTKNGASSISGEPSSQMSLFGGETPSFQPKARPQSSAPKTKEAATNNKPGASESRPSLHLEVGEHFHPKLGRPVHIATMDEKDEDEHFDHLASLATAHGGHYSRPHKDTPEGFAFRDEDRAHAFVRNAQHGHATAKPTQEWTVRPHTPEGHKPLDFSHVEGLARDEERETQQNQIHAAMMKHGAKLVRQGEDAYSRHVYSHEDPKALIENVRQELASNHGFHQNARVSRSARHQHGKGAMSADFYNDGKDEKTVAGSHKWHPITVEQSSNK